MSSMLGNDGVQLCQGLEQLKGEHPPLLNKIDEIEELCTIAEKQIEINEDFKKIRPTLIKFAEELHVHSTREENHLFEMMAVYIGRDVGPIAVMEYEHEQAHGLIDKFLENTKSGYESYTTEKVNEDIQLVKQAAYTLKNHFAKEENVLYPMAENMFSEEEKQELLERIQII